MDRKVLRREQQALLTAQVVAHDHDLGVRRGLREQQGVERDVVLLQHPLRDSLGIVRLKGKVHQVVFGATQAARGLVDAPGAVDAQPIALLVETLGLAAQSGHPIRGELGKAVCPQLVQAPLAQGVACLVEEPSPGKEGPAEVVDAGLAVLAPGRIPLPWDKPEQVDVEAAQDLRVRLHDLQDPVEHRGVLLLGHPEVAQEVRMGFPVEGTGRAAHGQRDPVSLVVAQGGQRPSAMDVAAHVHTPTMCVRPWLWYRSVHEGRSGVAPRRPART